jgi:LysM repeat protein
VAAIQAANPGVNPNNLQIGQVICIPVAPPTVCPAGTFAYIVQPGDTFFLLAQRFNTTVAAIQAANPTVNPNNLQVGSTLCIPGAAPGVCPPGTFAYIVRPGDTFFLLAQRFNTTVAAIQALNPTVDPNNLVVGSTLCIPGTPPPAVTCPAGSAPYAIQVGDTIAILAVRFGTTEAAILSINPGIDPQNLQIGQVICIPVTA